MTEESRLYRVHSTVDGWKHRRWFYDGVEITWLACREAEERYAPPWTEEPVVDPETGKKRHYLASAVDELFTREEAETLVAYLKEAYGDDSARMWEYPTTPIPASHMGLSAVPLGGGVDQISMREWKEGYPFDFDVRGYFDVRHAGEPTHREPYRECTVPGCSEDGVHVWMGAGDETYAKDEEGWVHMCEAHHEMHLSELRVEAARRRVDEALSSAAFADVRNDERLKGVVYDACVVGLGMPTERYECLSAAEQEAVDAAIDAVNERTEADLDELPF